MTSSKISLKAPNFITNSHNFNRKLSNDLESISQSRPSTFSRNFTFEIPKDNFKLDNYSTEKNIIRHMTTCPQMKNEKKEINLDLYDIAEEAEPSHRFKLEKEINKLGNPVFSQSCKNSQNLVKNMFGLNNKIIDPQLKLFLLRPLGQELWHRSSIERKFSDKKTIKFVMTNEKGEFLLSVLKLPKKSYKVYMSQEMNIEAYLGKLKSNFFGTEFNAWDSGKKPRKEKNSEFHRHNLTTITYVKGFFIT